ncbi:GH35 family beta-galactosidase [Mucilaginibacter polytrichastri]|uniref:Beta-galactosidase GanA n=1 Tax=Mucilaginibacter polytrichastri TaxID=1302689 RepID=A0A1Q5ZV03_9SPHI|nr:DUF5597 domain-containing protein [Mucilaginibacter polytrichastri]OKS85595.1 hypothetical protein RG47T_1041 [Mucilaginibacter polytrichastri]SFS35989.1 Beta-galactosidase [Mucilaginibacter polytrichastri]
MKTVILFLACLFTQLSVWAQAKVEQIPRIIEKNGRHALLIDGKPFLILGGQAHNSSAWPGMMPSVWAGIKQLHANTLEVPLYWEQIEPQQGKFNFSIVDTLLAQARARQVRLVFLWFATWKNGSNHYMPQWMKADAAKYPNIHNRKGNPIDSPSPHAEATLNADIKAFTAVMSYLKKADPQHTVIMVQVENEPGSWDSIRDYAPDAQKLFEGQVPAELLKPAILTALNVPVITSGTWQKVFGGRADEYFQAWSISRFIGKVAAAGKAVYPLPLYVNAALRDPLSNPSAPSYESGGPTDNVIQIWKAAAPAIDILAPDIYLSGSERALKVLELYDRPDNALFVPEAGFIKDNAKYLYNVIARGGIGFSPFGIDYNAEDPATDEAKERYLPYAHAYAAIAPMMRELAQWGFEGKVQTVVEHEDQAEQTIDLGQWKATVTFGSGRGGTQKNVVANGKAMIVKLSPNKFVLMGTHSHIAFTPAGNQAGKAWQYLKVEEGKYQNGVFKPIRILNGDETDWGGPSFGETPSVVQCELIIR